MREYLSKIMQYKSSLQIAREWLEKGLISKSEYQIISHKLANKYDVHLDSIFVEIAG